MREDEKDGEIERWMENKEKMCDKSESKRQHVGRIKGKNLDEGCLREV